MKVLITGGLGYLGGRISKHLAVRGGHHLVLTSRRPPRRELPWLAQGEVAVVDLLAAPDLRPLCEGVDCVVHLAALNEVDSGADPLRALEVNGLASLRLLLAAQEAGVRRFIYLSTAHVYGPLKGHISEQTLPRPSHPYAISHKTAEDFVLAAQDRGALEGVVVRLSNGFGAPLFPEVNRWTLLVNDLCRQAAGTGRLVLHSTGQQVRDFIPLHDVCRAVEHLVALPGPELADGLFNLGGELPLSVLAMTRLVAARAQEVLGFVPEIEVPTGGGGPAGEELDYSLAKLKQTGFTLAGSPEREIDDTLLLCQGAFGGAR